MPLEAPLPPLAERAADLNRRFADSDAPTVLAHALTDPQIGRTALVSSFGADSVVLLHMVARIDPATPVLFLNTEMLFPQTLTYQQRVAETLGLTDIRVLGPDREAAFLADPDTLLHRSDPDACCALRKTEPLRQALAGFEAWITGRKRAQGGIRQALAPFEAADNRLKVNPLAHWTPADVQDYIQGHDLPRHPLVAEGYASLGCKPCTTRVHPGEDDRAGRWRGRDKTECGIHFDGGRIVRGAA